NYNVPYFFQQLVSNLFNLRATLDNEKYWKHLYFIRLALSNYQVIILNNKVDNASEEIANLKRHIETHTDIILELTHRYRPELVKAIRQQHAYHIELDQALTKAIYGTTDSIKFPPEPQPNVTFPPSQIDDWINQIGEAPTEEPWWKMLGHTFYYMQKTSYTAIAFFSFSIGSLIQSTIDYLITDISREYCDTESAIKERIAHITIPLIFFGLSTAITIVAMVATKWYRDQRRKQDLYEVQTADIDQPPSELNRTPSQQDIAIPIIQQYHYRPYEPQYSGHYTNYNLPYYFEKLVITLKELRSTLDNEKYWKPLYQIRLCLAELHEIIWDNKLDPPGNAVSAIDLQVANLSTTIQAQIDVILGLTRSYRTENVRATRDQHSCRNTLVKHFKNAINGHNNPDIAPPPETKLLPNALPSQIDQWIKEIGEKPKEEPFWRMFGHTFYYASKASYFSIGFLALFVGSATQSLFDFLLTDLGREFCPDETITKELVAQLTFPLSCCGFFIFTTIAAMSLTKKHRDERREEDWAEIEEAKKTFKQRASLFATPQEKLKTPTEMAEVALEF
ncbi:MAG: hypothetical protein KDH94_02850, partial [Coxiellaceae bacterium]|nr:hypothetical protein [Coxiellaceae bacterium]